MRADFSRYVASHVSTKLVLDRSNFILGLTCPKGLSLEFQIHHALSGESNLILGLTCPKGPSLEFKSNTPYQSDLSLPLQSPLSRLCLLLGLSGCTGLLALVNTPSLFQLQLCSFLYPLCGNLFLNLSHPVSSHSQSTSLRVLLKCYLVTKTSLTTTSRRVPFNPIYQPCNLSSFHTCFL